MNKQKGSFGSVSVTSNETEQDKDYEPLMHSLHLQTRIFEKWEQHVAHSHDLKGKGEKKPNVSVKAIFKVSFQMKKYRIFVHKKGEQTHGLNKKFLSLFKQ